MKKLYCILMIVLLLNPVLCKAEEIKESENGLTEPTEIKEEIVVLEACVDGDTAKFKKSTSEVISARFLAVDTPETVHPTQGEEAYGKDASEYTCNLLTNAKEIKLEYDENSDEEDKYGRKLVWVFVDGVLLQESLISKGYAEVSYLYDDYKYTSLLQDAEAVAKVNKVGMWSLENKEIEEKKDKKETKVKKKEKSFIDKLVDDLLATITDFLNDLLEKLLKSIEDML